MTQEITEKQKILILRNGVEIYLNEEEADNLGRILTVLNDHKFIQFKKELFNTRDIVGIFEPQTMDELTRRKKGEWRCEGEQWHARNENCDCALKNYKTWEKIKVEKGL